MARELALGIFAPRSRPAAANGPCPLNQGYLLLIAGSPPGAHRNGDETFSDSATRDTTLLDEIEPGTDTRSGRQRGGSRIHVGNPRARAGAVPLAAARLVPSNRGGIVQVIATGSLGPCAGPPRPCFRLLNGPTGCRAESLVAYMSGADRAEIGHLPGWNSLFHGNQEHIPSSILPSRHCDLGPRSLRRVDSLLIRECDLPPRAPWCEAVPGPGRCVEK